MAHEVKNPLSVIKGNAQLGKKINKGTTFYIKIPKYEL